MGVPGLIRVMSSFSSWVSMVSSPLNASRSSARRTWPIILRSVPRPPEASVSLVRIATRDGVPLDGVFTEPRGRHATALIWVHGLGSVFSSGQPLTRELSTRLNAAGIAYFKLNTRGHDVVARAG